MVSLNGRLGKLLSLPLKAMKTYTSRCSKVGTSLIRSCFLGHTLNLGELFMSLNKLLMLMTLHRNVSNIDNNYLDLQRCVQILRLSVCVKGAVADVDLSDNAPRLKIED